MSIVRSINGKDNSQDSLTKKYQYITDPVKTNNGKLIGTNACFIEHNLDDWFSVKKAFHKSKGKQGEHIVLSLTPDNKDVPDDTYLTIANEVANLIYTDHNCIYAVHTDSKYRHIHFLVNTVSFKDGKRYHLSKSELAELRAAYNRILERHKFDIIKSKAESIVDETPYDLSDGFDFMEITDYESDDNQFTDIIIDAADDEKWFSEDQYVKPENSDIGKYNYNKPDTDNQYQEHNYYEGAYANMNTNNYFMTKGSYLPQDIVVQPANTSTDDTHAKIMPLNSAQTEVSKSINLADRVQNIYPTIHLNFSPNITVNVASSTDSHTVTNYINAVTPKTNTGNTLKYILAMANEFDQRNISMNIDADLFPNITINVSDENAFHNESDIIDINRTDISKTNQF